MASHLVARVLRQVREGGEVHATLELACGCTVERTIPGDRLLAREDGTSFVAGKIPCPVGHPVSARR
jgi:hypothetical protein